MYLTNFILWNQQPHSMPVRIYSKLTLENVTLICSKASYFITNNEQLTYRLVRLAR